ncbi:MAG: hypothetical protein MRZ79_25525 [Bacteroidia bacterium]|nr:hypothetical protein [Bacteroidia bacterium]
MSLYVPPSVLRIQQLHAPIIDHPKAYSDISLQLEAFATISFEAWKSRDSLAWELISNFHPDYLGKAVEELHAPSLNMDDFLLMTCREHGFTNWDELQKMPSRQLDPAFEVAIDLLLSGHKEALRQHFRVFPRVVKQKSVYGHRATLLHYLSSNGIEMRRQFVPANLTEMIEILLEFGADKQAKMHVYGGDFTFWELYSTGAHPYAAGIDEGQVKSLIA